MNPLEPLMPAFAGLIPSLASLVRSLGELESRSAGELAAVDRRHLESARNLIHYLALRRHDLRELQDRLAAVGLSSLGRAEPGVAATLDAVARLVSHISVEPLPLPVRPPLSLADGRLRLTHNTEALLGPLPHTRHVRVMVTLPSEAADDPALAVDLVRGGMNLARINCAHDDAAAWAKMIAHVRAAAVAAGVQCRVLMDLGGPKLRTGALEPGPQVLKLKPKKDACGAVIEPARVWLTDEESPRSPAQAMPVVPVSRAILAGVQAGDIMRLVDARGSARGLEVVRVAAGGCEAAAARTTYLRTGMRLRRGELVGIVGTLPAVEVPLVLKPGDRLTLTASSEPGRMAPTPTIPCTLSAVFLNVRAGERIWLDDGRIGGRVTHVEPDRVIVEIIEASPLGSKLRADKGINLPDTQLELPALDAKDIEDLPFVAAHADLVGYSFVRRPSDVIELQERLKRAGRADLGIVLKIETRESFEQLPSLLLAGMRGPGVGVMIARGDLAVECGWERLAEEQEEILWVCEAAHVPVIWATQVLEKLTKYGQPTRAEITDAAMSVRAECVMLNKGAYVREAVHMLDDILRRMEAHQVKKRPMLRPLRLAERFAGRTS